MAARAKENFLKSDMYALTEIKNNNIKPSNLRIGDAGIKGRLFEKIIIYVSYIYLFHIFI